jgi:hypothetical protein
VVFCPGPNYALNDTFLRERVHSVIAEQNIEVVVETGLNDGQSTLEFCRMAPFVFGVDNDPRCVETTCQRLVGAGVSNYELLTGHSPDMLRALLPRLPDKTLYMLDAHWECVSPIFDEIQAVRKNTGVLLFHDIRVPGKDFGYDGVLLKTGEIKDLEYELIQADLTAWSPNHRVEFMQEANGCYRGAAFVYPS